MSWISVDERLPEAGVRVILHSPDVYPTVTVGRFVANETRWYCEDETEWVGEKGWPTPIYATHWMPLPPAP